MNQIWNAKKYTSDFSFVHEYGAGVMDLIDFSVANSALDLGCGNGALTKALKEKGLSVVGLDASAELLEVAHKNYDDIQFVQADATHFSLPEKVDVVFSNAVFHWIDAENQSKMLLCVADALNDGGQFVFEFGGYGCNALIHKSLERAFNRRGLPYAVPFYFPTIGEYAPLVEQAGMRVTTALLFDRMTELKGSDGLRDWIEMFVRVPFAAIDSEAERNAIICETVDELRPALFHDGKWHADYVRIRMRAVKDSEKPKR